MPKFEMESDKDVSIDEKAGVVYPPHYQEEKMISVDDIIFDTTQARHGEWENDDLDLQLMSSVEEIGLIYNIMVRPTDSVKYGGNTNKPYACVAGSRRFNSMIAAGHTEVPCIIRDLSDIEAVMYSLSENIGRKPLSPFQEQRAVNLWFDMLWEERIGEFIKENEIDDIEDDEYKGDRRMIKASVVQEIDKKIYGGNASKIYEVLGLSDMSYEEKILLKKVSERTPEDIAYLKSQGIKKDFVVGYKGFLLIKQIKEKFLEEFSQSEKTQKIFEMIKKGKIDKESEYKWQVYILKDIRDEFKKGKSFELVMEGIKTNKEKFSMDSLLEKYTYRINIPTEYRSWHKKACTEARKTDGELIYYIYLTWLKKEAKKNKW